MSKRKRQIQKRKKLAEDTAGDESVLAAEFTGGPGDESDLVHDAAVTEDAAPESPPVDDSQIVAAPRPAAEKKKASAGEKGPDPKAVDTASTDSWLGQNKENLLLGLLVLYVVLLGLGTVGELFEIEWILNLPLFK